MFACVRQEAVQSSVHEFSSQGLLITYIHFLLNCIVQILLTILNAHHRTLVSRTAPCVYHTPTRLPKGKTTINHSMHIISAKPPTLQNRNAHTPSAFLSHSLYARVAAAQQNLRRPASTVRDAWGPWLSGKWRMPLISHYHYLPTIPYHHVMLQIPRLRPANTSSACFMLHTSRLCSKMTSLLSALPNRYIHELVVSVRCEAMNTDPA
jgi:hypothetical protein